MGDSAVNKDAERLYIENEKLLWTIVKKYFPWLIADDDMMQEARMAFWRACCDYDPSVGKISSFASRYIRTDLIKQIRFRNAQKRGNGYVTLSLDYYGSVPDGIDVSRSHNPSAVENMNMYETMIASEDIEWCDIQGFMDSLSEREREVVKYLYAGYGAREIAKKMRCSHQNVYQLINAARKKFDKYI